MQANVECIDQTKRRSTYRGVAMTRLEHFIRARGLFPAHIARASDVCRSRLQLWRSGKSSPMLTSIRKLVQGMRAVTDDPAVEANDLFPLDDDD